MLNLTDREWETFFIGQLFTVKRPSARSEKNYENGDLPFVASGNVNNGVIRCCKPHDNEVLDKGNCITVSPVDGSAFYQQSNFLGRGGAGSSVLMLYCTKINKYSGLFIARMIRQTCSKYCYGKMGSQDSIKRERILLPIRADGEPDYDFMEEYIKEREAKMKNEYLDYCKQQLEIIGGGYNLIPLADKRWKAFFIGGDKGLFEIYSGKRLTVANMNKGKCPFIGATDSNNGITNWVSNINNTYDSNVLGVNYNGSVVENFYHPYHCIFSDDVKRLHLKEHADNKYVLLFFSTLILMQKTKYTYGYKFNGTRMNRQKILVPIKNNNKPDYEYMEKYIRNLLRNKIQNYIDYVIN